jgi:hypothetical protein
MDFEWDEAKSERNRIKRGLRSRWRLTYLQDHWPNGSTTDATMAKSA